MVYRYLKPVANVQRTERANESEERGSVQINVLPTKILEANLLDSLYRFTDWIKSTSNSSTKCLKLSRMKTPKNGPKLKR